MFGAAASVLILYTFALHLDMSAWAGRQMVLLGRYSLPGYLVQIALIRAIVKIAGRKPEHWAGVIAVGVLTIVLLFFIVNKINSLRQCNRPVDIIYKGVFA
jgi:peptidoglycan/LPS O-acetylase OafA/YrhL